MPITQEEFNTLMANWLAENGGQYNSAHTGQQIDAAVTAVRNKEATWDAGVLPAIGTNGYMHVSFDDVDLCIKNLTNNTYDSLFDEPFFAFLKELHERYSAKFSLYVFNDVFTLMPDTYKAEFAENAEWLKFGLHATDSSSSFENAYPDACTSAWNTFVENALRVTGSYTSIDRVPRLHLFAGNIVGLNAMRKANCGALGFLSADDNRMSYYMDGSEAQYLYENRDSLYDYKTGLIFFRTDFRADWFATGYTSEYEYHAPTQADVYDELAYRYRTAKYADTFKSLIWFTHEHQSL